MRVLIISNTPFLPVTAGNRARIDQMVGFFLRADIEVGMLMLPAPDLREWDVDGMRARLAYFEVAAPPANARPAVGQTSMARVVTRLSRTTSRLVRRAFPRQEEPIGVDDWCPPWFRERAAATVRQWAPDVVLVEYVFLSACLEGLGEMTLRPPTSVIDTHDIMHQRRGAYRRAGLAPRWFHTSYAEERRGLARADVVLAIRDDDAHVLRRMLGQRTVITVPHGYPVQPAPTAAALGNRLLFVASYNDLNVDGLRWFLDTVWPRLRNHLPDVELVVCGNISEKLERIPAGVTLRGVVPSLAPEYAKARIVISPVRGGTGLQVKVAEALCHGRPVVTTALGALGNTAEAGDGVVVAESTDDFVAAVRCMLTNPLEWSRMAAAAAACAARRFAPEVAFAPLMHRLRAARRDRGQDARPC